MQFGESGLAGRFGSRRASARRWAVTASLGLLTAAALPAATLSDARQLFIKGQYEECIRQCEGEAGERLSDEEWRLLLVRSLLAVGRYTNAQAVVTAALERNFDSIRLRLLAREVFLLNGQASRAQTVLYEINSLAGTRSRYSYQDSPNLVALGQAALLLGADPRQVLENFFDRAKRSDPTYRETYLASGQVALDKNDFDLAAKTFSEGLKRFAADPDMHCGLARAYASGDRRRMLDQVDQALTSNSNHVSSYLLLADHLIDGEEYQAADKTLKRALDVNPWHPEVWAYLAVLAHLEGDAKGESRSRQMGMWFWESNPAVDHLIGKKLSQKYRFTEGAAYQRQALRFDPKYLPAKIQLAQDLLRLGNDEPGWQLAEQVHAEDGYDVTAYNLATLKETMSKFRVLTNADFIVRMSAHEADVYGQRVMELLQQAKTTLCAKYGLRLDRPTTVEIFPDQKDFGVRTFGMPHNPGFLGVCFGFVITANSPAAQAGHPANWEAVLWHEFCHVVTLQLTRNKMPRWLSEGISVYEERLANPTWGQSMTPRYREMVLGEDLTPVGELSAAFLTPKTDEHLQFAYYESSLVVEFLVARFGVQSLNRILRDLAEGVEINDAIARHTAPLEKIEKDFAAFAKDRAEKLAPGLDWEKPEPQELAGSETELKVKYPNNFYVLAHRAKKFLREKQYEEAKAPLQKLLEQYPGHTSPGNAYELLALAHRGLNETNQERQVLEKLATLDADAMDAFLRLMELASPSQDWGAVIRNAGRFLAVNPLLPQPYRHLARASEGIGKAAEAIQAYRTLLRLDPPDPAEAHFRLGRLLHERGDAAAKRHVLQALEEAPRYRDAHRLLLQMSRAHPPGLEPAATPTPPAPAPASPPPPQP